MRKPISNYRTAERSVRGAHGDLRDSSINLLLRTEFSPRKIKHHRCICIEFHIWDDIRLVEKWYRAGLGLLLSTEAQQWLIVHPFEYVMMVQ